MGLFDFFKKKKTQLIDEQPTDEQHNYEQTKLDRLWDMWTEGQAPSPCAELMTYQSEINNGGHDQYFLNVNNVGDLQQQMEILNGILPEILKANLKRAHDAYLVLESNEDDEEASEILEQCDDVFYENESEINTILESYADTLEL